MAAFHKGLRDAGFVEGRNLTIEYRWAYGDKTKLPAMASDLIRRKVALITTPGSTPASLAAKAATTTIPIVFGVGSDPVKNGLVASIGRPGGNATGITSLNAELVSKRLGWFRNIVTNASRHFMFINPTSNLTGPFLTELRRAATSLGVDIEVLRASTDREIDVAFASIPEHPGSVIIFSPDSFFYTRRTRIAEEALRRKLPTTFDVRDYVDAGGLMSYGTDFLNVMEITAVYVGRVLKGEKPTNLPVQQPTKFELVVNLRTAKALGLEVPQSVLIAADALIE
ncbi:MAG: ABC transporter substrate-binding protein [Woeseiaceae bacterium]|nr:ABC transporter substrate-binding protein [Woeseiaceae bacterium]